MRSSRYNAKQTFFAVSIPPPVLYWNPSVESSENVHILVGCRVNKCNLFSSGQCPNNKPFCCFDYHFEFQRRRSPVTQDGMLRYWDVPCESAFSSSTCLFADQCIYCHTSEELQFHPARFRTRMCPNVDCSNPLCTFAHSQSELRKHAPMSYSVEYTGPFSGRPPPPPLPPRGRSANQRLFPTRLSQGGGRLPRPPPPPPPQHKDDEYSLNDAYSICECDVRTFKVSN
eukprot:GHVL01025805.1.p1 GENE.GHVL01025805.1~~GHVL01025805.1.p1  ORF type:complete len:228 (+),score=40.59 GHVL01025805.1:32-715(+)